MTIFIISIVALGLGVVLMKEYGWADLTGNTRNDLVFEKRNKNYGAYEIRQKYSNRLLIAFVGMLGFISIAAVSPKMFMHSVAKIEKQQPHGPKIGEITNIEKPKEKEKEEIIENVQPEKPQPPAGAATQAVVTPTPTSVLQKVDSTINKNAIVANVTSIGDTSSKEYRKPVLNPGNCLNCTPIDSTTIKIHPSAGVDELASFDYGPYIRKHLRLPENLAKGGKIYISFVVDETGSISAATIKKGVSTELDNEVRRVISGMPKWKPAKLHGIPVKVRMVLPVNIAVE